MPLVADLVRAQDSATEEFGDFVTRRTPRYQHPGTWGFREFCTTLKTLVLTTRVCSALSRAEYHLSEGASTYLTHRICPTGLISQKKKIFEMFHKLSGRLQLDRDKNTLFHTF